MQDIRDYVFDSFPRYFKPGLDGNLVFMKYNTLIYNNAYLTVKRMRQKANTTYNEFVREYEELSYDKPMVSENITGYIIDK